MSPISALFQSRKFLLMLVDVVVSFSGYFVTKYVSPAAAEDVLYIIAGTQPVVIAVIAAIAYEDGQAKAAGKHEGRFK